MPVSGVFLNVFGDGDHAAETDVRDGTTYNNGNLTGSLDVGGGTTPNYPDEAEVLLGVAFGTLGSEEYTGNVRLPTADQVINPVAFGSLDSLTGNWYAPDATEVLDSATFGVGDATPGRWHAPLAAEVIDSATFGVDNLVPGEYDTTPPTPPNYPEESEVLLGIAFGTTGSEEFTGNVRLPAAKDVRNPILFGPADAITGNYFPAAENDVRAGTQYGNANTEFTGLLDVTGDPPIFPSVNDVRLDVTFGTAGNPTQFAGTVRVPPVAKVEDGYMYDANDTLEGTLVGNVCDYPIEADVVAGVSYDSGNLVGTYVCGISDPGDVEWLG